MSEPMFFNLQCSLVDHPETISAVVYTKFCNWNCWGCHNMKYLLKGKDLVSYTMEDIIKAVKNPIVELLIITGGEPLAQGDDFIDALRYLRQHITKPIRIDTNGTSPSLVELIKNEKLADGFAMDIKFPYWLDDQDNILHKITGVKDIDKTNILKTMRLVDGMPFSLFRTVRYPILSNDLLDNIVDYIKNNFKSPHFVNNYYNIKGEVV